MDIAHGRKGSIEMTAPSASGSSDVVIDGYNSDATPRYDKGGFRVDDKNIAAHEIDSDMDEERINSKSTTADAYNMRRMGKPQQLVRHFRVLSVASFVAIATAAWEIGLLYAAPPVLGIIQSC